MRTSDLATYLSHHIPSGVFAALTVPCLILAAYLFGGEVWLFYAALSVPLPFLLLKPRPAPVEPPNSRDGLTGCLTSTGFRKATEERLGDISDQQLMTACFCFELDGFNDVRTSYGDRAAEEVLKYTARRTAAALRSKDIVARIDNARFCVALDPVRSLDLETCLQLASRLQTALEEPVPLELVSVHPTCTMGLGISSRLTNITPSALIEAAELALTEAQRAGEGSIRSFHEGLRSRAMSRRKSENEAARALDRGQVQAWFQPQVSTDTGEVTGFETLARWEHPGRGVVPPAEFIPILRQSGQLEKLANQMLSNAFEALNAWEQRGFHIPTIGVNFAGEELRNPTLPDHVRWELDRFSLTPDRLSVEVLETVVAGSPNDIVVRNINELAAMGCRIDLDDFGTGHASISSIRNLRISRLKIDRSFVTRLDQDIEQERMVTAILTMSERLGLDTLAEGVETPAEHAMLAQLGCRHVQGFGIARPMPLEDSFAWLWEHQEKLGSLPEIGRQP